MNLKNLTDVNLLKDAERLVGEEREILSKVLHYLREIHRRRLYCDLGFKSLHQFAVQHLKYSDDQAARRISAMRLMTEIPEIEEKITSGELNISQIGVAQSFFKQEAKIENYFTKNEKLELLNEISPKSTREAIALTKSYSSEDVPSLPDRIKVITDKKVELRFEANKDLLKKIEMLKGLLAHKFPNITLGELFSQLCDLGIKAYSPATSPVLRVRKSAGKTKSHLGRSEKNLSKDSNSEIKADLQIELNDMGTKDTDQAKNKIQDKKSENGRTATPSQVSSSGASSTKEITLKNLANQKLKPTEVKLLAIEATRKISKIQIRRNVFAKAQNRCQNCNSVYALEVDHIVPRAMGGTDTEDNLRILCRTCNQRAAIKIFGINKMAPFLEIKT